MSTSSFTRAAPSYDLYSALQGQTDTMAAAVQRKRRPLEWDKTKLQALNLVFEGRKSLDKVALDVAVSARTLDRWIAHPDFQAALKERRDNLVAALDGLPYIRKERRLIALAQMAESARQQYEERPLLVERRPTGRDPDTGELWYMEQEAFNRDAHAAFRDSLNDIAKELGERSSNVHVTAPAQLGVSIVLEQMRDDHRIANAANDFLGLIAAAAEAR